MATQTTTGLRFPADCAGRGRFGIARGTDKFEQNLVLILQTYPGERVMRPDFGCRLRDFVFEPLVPSTGARIADEVERAIRAWEPAVEVDAVEVTPNGSVDGLVHILIGYHVRGTGVDGELGVDFSTDGYQPVAAGAGAPGVES
ncbi:GPW/gp25 family protein [Kribbella sp. DT2]|uniref:GPW/gp25 family protein n=1 Tax=Kribbella sp. DT2 TaxID=3393427 RepID=UPI003CF19F3D